LLTDPKQLSVPYPLDFGLQGKREGSELGDGFDAAFYQGLALVSRNSGDQREVVVISPSLVTHGKP